MLYFACHHVKGIIKMRIYGLLNYVEFSDEQSDEHFMARSTKYKFDFFKVMVKGIGAVR